MQWLKEIPSHWKEKRAKYIYEKQNRIPEESDDVITCFRDGEVTLRKNRRTTGFTESFKEIGYQGIKKGDLVIHQMDAFAGATGVSDSDGKGTPVYSVCTPIDNQSLTKYHAMVIRLMGLNGFIQSLYRGIRERSSDFRFETFARQVLPLPPLAEQEKIVSYLEGKTSKIDAYVAEKEKEILLLQELKQKTIADAVTKGLNPDVKMKGSGISWIGMIPEHWETKRVSTFLHERKEKYNGDDSLSLLSLLKGKGVIPYEEKGNIGNKAKEDVSTYKVTRKGDVVVNCMNVIIGSSGITDYDGYISPAYYSFIPIVKETSIIYKHWLSLPQMQGAIRCMAKGILEIRLRVSSQQLLSMKIPIPPKVEQHAIVAYIDEKCKKIDTLVSELQAEIDNMKEYKQRLIADCVTGQVNVQDETI